MTCNSCASINSLYVVPSKEFLEVVILTDTNRNYGVITMPGNTLALSKCALDVLYNAFFVSYPSTVSSLSMGDYDTVKLLSDLSENRIIALTSTPPPLNTTTTYNVSQGGVINKTSPGTTSVLEPIHAQYAGCVICISIGSVRIYIYFGDVDLLSLNCNTAVNAGSSAVGDFGEFGISLYPQTEKMALGANCNACGLCGVCGACGACALCGGLNLGAAGVALSAIDAALAITNALSAFPTNE